MKFLNGIYGIDYLTLFLLILSSLFNIWTITLPLGFICLIYHSLECFLKIIIKEEVKINPLLE